ncbi:MAG: hypothetical protein JWN73_978 [Betaproteobacteria bacterium]|nr:hypothetical protein [Betaproteobacteria bacterium]
MKAYERWQFASLADDAPKQDRRAPAEEPPPGPSVAEVAAHELAVLRETARADGATAGFAAGRAEGLQAAAAEVEHLRRIAAAMAGAFTEMQDETALALLDLAVGTARHVLREELRSHPEAMLGAIREAIDLAGTGACPVLQLNPGDLGFVQRHLGEELGPGGWRLVEDARVEPGGCRVTTTSGSIDATLKTRWQRALASLGRTDPLEAPPADVMQADVAQTAGSQATGSLPAGLPAGQPAGQPNQ